MLSWGKTDLLSYADLIILWKLFFFFLKNFKDTTLSAYGKVLQTLPRASPKDVHFYRRWIQKHNPIAKPETRFLQHDLDLVSLNLAVDSQHENSLLYFLIGVLATALFLPLLAYWNPKNQHHPPPNLES